VDDLRRRLRETAEAHQPDRSVILARVEQGIARSAEPDRARSSRRWQASWLKVSLASLAVAGMGLGGVALAAGARKETPQRPTSATAMPTGGIVDATPQAHGSAASPAASAAPASSTPSGATASRQPASRAADGPISARGAVNSHSTVYWAQNDLTVDVAQPLTALTVELRIAQTGGVQSTGEWRTAPADDFTVSVAEADGFLVYRWTLKPGRTIPAAQQIFAAQYNHNAGKRDASKDTFRVETTVAGRAAAVWGNFPTGS
jgi:hypothetical protein